MFGNLNVTCRPIDLWPGVQTPQEKRKVAIFRASWTNTLGILRRELDALRAKQIVLMLAVSENEILQDGSRPRATARPSHPGVIIAFESMHGPVKLACDRFSGWQDNVRAIALTLHDLRRIDRYGTARRGEQYRGWRALPGPVNEVQVKTYREAAEILARLSERRPADVLVGEPRMIDAWRVAVRRTHPDQGGKAEEFRLVQEARIVLEAHFRNGVR
jgi:hypothetical protein